MDSIRVILAYLGSIIDNVLGLIFFFLIRIYFNIQIIGLYGELTSFLTLFSFIIDMGFATAYLKYYSEAKNDYEEELCNSTFFFYRLIQFSLYTLVVVILIRFVDLYNFDPIITYYFILIYILRVFGTIFISIILISKKQIVKKSLALIINSIFKIILLIIFMNFFQLNINLFANVLFISNLAFTILLIYWIKDIKFVKPNKIYLVKFLKFSLPFSITIACSRIMESLDVLFVNLWFPIGDVANYFTAKEIYLFLNIFLVNIAYIFLPTFSKNFSNKKLEVNKNILKKLHKFLNIIMVPIPFILLIYSEPFFSAILGTNYILSGTILTLLTFNLMIISLNYGNLVFLQSIGKVYLLGLFSILNAIFFLFSMIFFMSPNFLNLGAIGASLALIVSNCLIQLIFQPYIYKKYKIGFYWGVFRNLILIFIIFVFQLYINNILDISFYIIPLFILIDFLIYIALNYILKGFTKQDFKFIISLLKFKNIKKTIASEFKKI